MNTLDVLQGSSDWLKIRQSYSTASEAPAALGQSKYVSRSELLKQKSTGLATEINSRTQALFDRGHESEGSARPFAEKIISNDLYPITGTLTVDGIDLLASFDGITLDEEIIFEHKLWSEKLAADVRNGDLSQHYTIQIDQQLLVSGAKKCLFMVSDGTEEKMAWCWYESSQDKFDALIAGWKQFHLDLAEYGPAEVIEPVIATPTRDLPALSIRVDGAISLVSNLDKFGALLGTFIQGINTKPDDDQGFADAEAAIKTLQAAQDALEAAESNALAQTSSIDDMRRTVKLHVDTARTTRLMLEKIVKARKETIRIEIVTESKTKFVEHIESLNKRLGYPYMPAIAADFVGSMKGLKTITSIRNAVDTELARVKIESNAIADKIEINLKSLAELTADHAFLFADTASIIMKENADLILLIKSRIDEHMKAEAAKAETLRAQIQQEEKAKAEATVEAARIAELKRQQAEHDANQAALRQELEQATAQREEQFRIDRQASVLGAAQDRRHEDAALPPPSDAFVRAFISVATEAPTATDDGGLVNLGTINAALGFTVSAEFLAGLGFTAQVNKSAKLYREVDFQRICTAIIWHIQEVAATPLKAAS